MGSNRPRRRTETPRAIMIVERMQRLHMHHRDAPRAILGLYIDPDAAANAAMVGFAVRFMLVAAAFQLFDGVQAVAAGALRGLQDTRTPMLIALFAHWVPGLGTSIWLGFFTPLEGFGIWLGLASGLVVAAGLLTARWARRARLGLLPA